MRPIVVSIVTSLCLAVMAFPVVAPAAIGEPNILIRNTSGNEMLVTVHVMLPPLYEERWVAPGKVVTFNPGPMAWKGILYISVRASQSSQIDKSSPHICLSSMAIRGDYGRTYSAHYNGHDCSISQD